ncbi:MAG: GWxTD domain-containing protein [Flavobacteriales bacterium]|nr:GWxTD domain-containing protein [Flavobacteriales bacterium]
MKKAFYILLIPALLSSFSALAGNLRAHFTYCAFSSPAEGPYLETYLSVNAGSAIYKKNEAGNFQSKIEITMLFKQGEEIKNFKKYELLSPELTDSLSPRVDFLDQQRIPLADGDYDFEIMIRDLNATDDAFQSTQQLHIGFPNDKVGISDIELVESLQKTTEKNITSKSGYDVIPYTSDFYSEEFEKIAFYAEVYHTDLVLGNEEGLLINYFIESQETGSVVGNYRSFIRETAKPVIVILNSFSIEKLPSGNYNLGIEVKNKLNETLAEKKIFFQRSNPEATPLLLSEDYLNSFVATMDKALLAEAIRSVEPISTDIEINFAQNQLKGEDDDLMRQYFYNFWLTRNSTDPEAEWKKYFENVKITNELFATSIKKGYETDRGRVFLKHGKPNTRRAVPSEPNAYPYEVWHYYKIGNFSNKRFVFYNPDLVSNDFPLLHSDMPGYLYYPQWKVMLHKRTTQPIDMDTENDGDHYGSRANDYFSNPR